MDDAVILYTTEWCGHCHRLKRQLTEAGIGYTEVDVEIEAHHGDRIIAATGGYRTVPSVDVRGRLLVNPSLAAVQAALA
jgi:mycoredoxin